MARLDLGDAILELRLLLRGKRLRLVWHIGPVRKSTTDQRQVKFTNWLVAARPAGRIDTTMDLMADKQVSLSLEFTDEMGNPVNEVPGSISATYTIDNPTILNLTDNGDGTAVVAAVGTLGTANVHVAVVANGQQLSGDLGVTVVAGLAERLNVVAGEPTEVTPDNA
jgi:hypothetical protein